MNTGGYSLAFAAGVVAALNPCGFAMLPGYLGLVAGQWGSVHALGRALVAALLMTLGFMAVFGVFALLAISVSELLSRVLPYLTLTIGVAMVFLGVRQLRGRSVGLAAMRLPQWDTATGSLPSMLGYGVVYALVSLSCTIAPFLAVTGIGLSGGSRAWSALAAYAAGFATVVGAVAVAGAVAGSILVRLLRRGARWVSLAGALLLVVAGLYVGYYGGYEVRLRNLSGPDPIISTAARVQGALAGWAHAATQSTATLGVLAAAGVGLIALSVRIGLRNKD